MKHLFLIITTSIFFCTSMFAQEATETYTLTVNLVGLSSSDGTVKVALCDKKENWLSDNVMGAEGTIENKVTTVTFENLSFGEFAISTFHDKNGNDEMDTNSFGIPKESYAFSNEAGGLFGPASFDDAKFLIDRNMEIIIKY